jgi:hypothetical protein
MSIWDFIEAQQERIGKSYDYLFQEIVIGEIHQRLH